MDVSLAGRPKEDEMVRRLLEGWDGHMKERCSLLSGSLN